MKAVLAAFNQKKALEGAFSVIMNLRMVLYEALLLDRIKLPLPPRQVRVRVGRVRGVGGAARPGGPAQLRPAPRHQRPHHQLQHPGQARLRRQGRQGCAVLGIDL